MDYLPDRHRAAALTLIERNRHDLEMKRKLGVKPKLKPVKPKQQTLRPTPESFRWGRVRVEAQSASEAIGLAVGMVGACLVDLNVENHGDGTWTVRVGT